MKNKIKLFVRWIIIVITSIVFIVFFPMIVSWIVRKNINGNLVSPLFYVNLTNQVGVIEFVQITSTLISVIMTSIFSYFIYSAAKESNILSKRIVDMEQRKSSETLVRASYKIYHSLSHGFRTIEKNSITEFQFLLTDWEDCIPTLVDTLDDSEIQLLYQICAFFKSSKHLEFALRDNIVINPLLQKSLKSFRKSEFYLRLNINVLILYKKIAKLANVDLDFLVLKKSTSEVEYYNDLECSSKNIILSVKYDKKFYVSHIVYFNVKKKIVLEFIEKLNKILLYLNVDLPEFVANLEEINNKSVSVQNHNLMNGEIFVPYEILDITKKGYIAGRLNQGRLTDQSLEFYIKENKYYFNVGQYLEGKLINGVCVVREQEDIYTVKEIVNSNIKKKYIVNVLSNGIKISEHYDKKMLIYMIDTQPIVSSEKIDIAHIETKDPDNILIDSKVHYIRLDEISRLNLEDYFFNYYRIMTMLVNEVDQRMLEEIKMTSFVICDIKSGTINNNHNSLKFNGKFVDHSSIKNSEFTHEDSLVKLLRVLLCKYKDERIE